MSKRNRRRLTARIATAPEQGFTSKRLAHHSIQLPQSNRIESMCDLNNLKVHWTADVTAFDEALEVITRTLKGFRPHVLTATNLVTGRPELGKPALVEIVREIQAADPTRPLGKVSKRERAMLRLQSELGDLVDRPGRLLEAKHRKPKGRK